MDKLDQIAQEGAALESSLGAEIPPGPGDAPPAGAASSPSAAAIEEQKVDMWAMLPKLVGSAICMALPELKEHYSTDNCRTWGAAMNEVAKKRGWDVGEMAPELAAVAATLGLFILPTTIAIVKRKQAAAEKRKQPDKPAELTEGAAVGDATPSANDA